MSTSREVILRRVRRALETGRVPAVTGAPITTGPVPAASQLLQRFLDELKALDVEAYVEAQAADVEARVAGIVAGRSVLAWDPPQLPYRVGNVLVDAATGASPRDVQAAAEIGVTGCDAAIAESGSLVLLSGPGKPRAASLLPPAHLAIVKRTDIRFSLAEFFRTASDAIAGAASCTVITGPSRTADIELTLTIGVHGPGRVIVVVGP